MNMVSMAPYRAHRHRKEILATRRAKEHIKNQQVHHGGANHCCISCDTSCSSYCLYQSASTHSRANFQRSYLTHCSIGVIQSATMLTRWTFILFLFLQMCSIRKCYGQPMCYPQCVCIWKGGKQTVECLDNRLTRIPATLSPDTQVLDMTGNNIQILPDNQFIKVNLLNLQKLFMRQCELRRIEAEAFAKLQNLVVLDLSDNMLVSVPVAAFRYPVSLRRLLLNGNPITRLEAGSFARLKALTGLEIRNSQLEAISDRAFRGLDNLQFLKLDGNRVQTLRGNALLPMKVIQAIDLHENPWSCDCHLKTIIEVMRQKNIHLNVPPICMGPPRLYKKRWDSVTLEEFACEPRVLDSSATYQESIVEGSNITLVCHVTGDPDPTIMWVHRGRVINNRTEIGSSGEFYSVSEVGNSDKTGALFIPYLRLQDSGRYACVAENIAGKSFRNFTLLILSHTVEVETIVNKDKPPAKVEETPPKVIIIAIGLGIGLLVMLIAILLFRCCRRQRRARNQGKANRQAHNTMYKHSNSTNHVPSVTTEASMVCDDHDITLLDVIKTKPLPRLGPYECIPTTDIDSFDMIPNKGHVGQVPPAYVVQPGAQNSMQNIDIWREYQQIPSESERTPLGLGVSYHRNDAPHHSNENEEQSGGFDSLQMRLQSELTDTLRRKGDKSRITPVSIPLPPNLDQRERGDGSSEQSNATAEFPDSNRLPAEKSGRDAEKRRHRQSWESMVNRNSCIIEDEDPRQDNWQDVANARSSGQEMSSPSMPMMQHISAPPKKLSNQPDCIQPIMAVQTVKRDTEV